VTPHLALTQAEADVIRDALTVPMCWKPQRRDEALAILTLAVERQQLALLAETA